jgi:hypothetical protein
MCLESGRLRLTCSRDTSEPSSGVLRIPVWLFTAMHGGGSRLRRQRRAPALLPSFTAVSSLADSRATCGVFSLPAFRLRDLFPGDSHLRLPATNTSIPPTPGPVETCPAITGGHHHFPRVDQAILI